MTQSDLIRLRKRLSNPRTAKKELQAFLIENPDAEQALHKAGINVNNPLIMLLLPLLLQFLQDWLAKQGK